MTPRLRAAVVLALAALLLSGSASAIVSSGDPNSNGQYPTMFSGIDINQLVGAYTLYNLGYYGVNATISNVEAGYIWGGHDVFQDRSTTITQIHDASVPGAYDWHATMVGHTLAGESPIVALTEQLAPGVTWTTQTKIPPGLALVASGSIPVNSSLWYGIAPQAGLGSAAIATSWVKSNTIEYGGEFNESTTSVYYAYKTSMTGTNINGRSADVLNSSWGGSDPAGNEPETRIIDALAYRYHQTVALAAGNSGEDADPRVGGPASGYNSITVGALGYSNSSFKNVATFSSRGPADFYNPVTSTTISAVRAAVDLVAPGDNLTLAFYGGLTGGHNASAIGAYDPTSGGTGYYIPGMAGTSFASPIVAGGAALLCDVAYVDTRLKNNLSADGKPVAVDGRVIKALLMNAADKTPGWTNGQHVNGTVLVSTQQSLDWAAGAGSMNLTRAYANMVSGVTDVAGTGGGTGLAYIGWDYGTLQANGHNDYKIADLLPAGRQFTTTLDWFVNLSLNDTTLATTETQFVNMDLQVWKLTGANGTPEALIAESNSVYNNVEHLYFSVPTDGYYMLRVAWSGENYGALAPTAESYGLAWYAPEPGTICVLLAGLPLLLRRRKAQ